MVLKKNNCNGTTLKGVGCKKKVLQAGDYCYIHRLDCSGLQTPVFNLKHFKKLCKGFTRLGLPCKNSPGLGNEYCRHHYAIKEDAVQAKEDAVQAKEDAVQAIEAVANRLFFPELDYNSYMISHEEFNLHKYLLYIEEPLRLWIKNSKDFLDILPQFKGNCTKLELETTILRSRTLRLFLSDFFIQKHISNNSVPVSRELYYQAEQLDSSTVEDCLIRYKSNIGYISRIHSEVLANSGELSHEFVSKCIGVDIVSGWRSDMPIPNAVVAMCVIFLEISRGIFSF
jgi:hypothetical protein